MIIIMCYYHKRDYDKMEYFGWKRVLWTGGGLGLEFLLDFIHTLRRFYKAVTDTWHGEGKKE